ncbi:MAG: TonB-dependent receptor, partial [Sphingomonas sp.]|nr:TonB-dependent receptor [Sphingomonas sp.]
MTDDIRFRGSYRSVVRSPNIGELFGATSGIPLLNITDPCANPTASGADVATCVASGAPAGGFSQNLTGALFLFGGDPNIQPETGKTWTAGAVLTPKFLKGFPLTADYYNIEIDNAIGAVLPQPTLNTCFVVVRDIDNIFCQRIKRGANGQLV